MIQRFLRRRIDRSSQKRSIFLKNDPEIDQRSTTYREAGGPDENRGDGAGRLRSGVAGRQEQGPTAPATAAWPAGRRRGGGGCGGARRGGGSRWRGRGRPRRCARGGRRRGGRRPPGCTRR